MFQFQRSKLIKLRDKSTLCQVSVEIDINATLSNHAKISRVIPQKNRQNCGKLD